MVPGILGWFPSTQACVCGCSLQKEKELWTFATISENSWTIATFLIVEEAESDQNLTKMNPPEMGCAHFGQLCVNKMLRILPAGWPPAGC